MTIYESINSISSFHGKLDCLPIRTLLFFFLDKYYIYKQQKLYSYNFHFVYRFCYHPDVPNVLGLITLSNGSSKQPLGTNYNLNYVSIPRKKNHPIFFLR